MVDVELLVGVNNPDSRSHGFYLTNLRVRSNVSVVSVATSLLPTDSCNRVCHEGWGRNLMLTTSSRTLQGAKCDGTITSTPRGPTEDMAAGSTQLDFPRKFKCQLPPTAETF